ncbi:MAG TPA: helix-turn-helix domain-containing protein [Solirubrobacteraceae bacterium]
MSSDVDTAAAAALIANRARCAMLDALFDGGNRTAGSLARLAGIAPSTASGHLRMLADGGLIVLEQRGRRQFARLASPEVAHALEALSTIAPTIASRTLRASSRARALREARTCYDHLAGALGVALTDALCAAGILAGDELALTGHGAEQLQRFGIDLPILRARRRPLTRACLDWSEQRPHLAGALGAALCQQLIDRAWITRMPEPRIVRLTPAGRHGLAHTFRLIDIPGPAA